jgi:tetratricopeptide (TPR) repeat protein
LFWPTGLAFFYPYSKELPAWQVGGAAFALLAITVAALCWLRSRPWFAVGWFWYLGTLVPVIGLVQVGSQSHADRYTYVPMIGLSIMLAWGLADLAGRWPGAKPVIAGLAAASCAACLCLTWLQVQYWEKSIVLFRHAIEVTDHNWVAHLNLGLVLWLMPGRLQDAIAEYRKAIADHGQTVHIGTGFWEGHLNLGVAYAQIPGRQADAITEYQTALRMNPKSTMAHFVLGNVLQKTGRFEEAIAEYRTALGMKPDYPEARYELAYALAQIPGRVPEAIAACRELLRTSPNDGPGRELMASLLAFQDSQGPGHGR